MGYTKTKWETYKKVKQYTQCFRCQRFGHGAMNCNMRPRCVKCGQEHLPHECNLVKTDTSKATCANCGGDHPANFGRCPELEKYLQTKLNRAKETAKTQMTARPLPASTVRQGMSYSAASRNETIEYTQHNALTYLANETTKMSQMCNLKQLLNILREANSRLA